MNKVYPDAAAALDGLLHDGMLIMAGGFGLCGIPEKLILAIRDSGANQSRQVVVHAQLHARIPTARRVPAAGICRPGHELSVGVAERQGKAADEHEPLDPEAEVHRCQRPAERAGAALDDLHGPGLFAAERGDEMSRNFARISVSRSRSTGLIM